MRGEDAASSVRPAARRYSCAATRLRGDAAMPQPRGPCLRAEAWTAARGYTATRLCRARRALHAATRMSRGDCGGRIGGSGTAALAPLRRC